MNQKSTLKNTKSSKTKEKGVIALFFLRIINFIRKLLRMAQIDLNTGASYNDPTADPIKTSFDNCQSNFDELYAAVAALQPVVISTYVEITDWNMTTTFIKTVNWSKPSGAVILSMQVTIISDSSQYYDFGNWQEGGAGSTSIYYNGTNQFSLASKDGGLFDSTLFDAATGTRGYIKIDYFIA